MLILEALINDLEKHHGTNLSASIVVDGTYREVKINDEKWWYITDKLYPYLALYGCIEKKLLETCATVTFDKLTEENKRYYKDALERMRRKRRRILNEEIELAVNGDSAVSIDDDDEDDNEDDDINSQPIPSPDLNPGKLLSDINRIICKYIDIEPHAAYAVTLWIAFTWFIDKFYISPLLIITADDERHDNISALFSLLLKLSKNAVRANSISTSIFLKFISSPIVRYTLLYDDPTAIKNRNTLNLMHSSYKRSEAYIRNICDEKDKGISIFGAKALVSHDDLPKSVKHKGIVLELNQLEYCRRADRLSQAEPEMIRTLKRHLEEFAYFYCGRVYEARPEMPTYLNNSVQDNWEPLFKIAMVAGEDWLDKAVQASIWLSEIEDKDKVICEQLLSDVYDIVHSIETDRIRTETLISGLCADAEKPWATYDRSENITPIQLASLLKKFGLKSKQMRIDSLDQPNKRGYYKRQIEKAYERYIVATTM